MRASVPVKQPAAQADKLGFPAGFPEPHVLSHSSIRGIIVVVGRCSFLPVNNYIDEDLLKLLI